jgi:hypothetical protein
MSRSLIRSGVVALFVFCLSMPAQALPLGEAGSFEFSLPEIWERLTGPLVSLWTEDGRGTCDPNGGGCTNSGETPDSRGTCDPNGGGCDS